MCIITFEQIVFFLNHLLLSYYDLPFAEADSQPFSILGAKTQEEEVDAYDIVQAIQEVQIQHHAPKSRPVDTAG